MKLTCPECGHTAEADISPGTTVRCPKCKTRWTHGPKPKKAKITDDAFPKPPWYYTALQVASYLWVIASAVPALLGLATTAALVLSALYSMIAGNAPADQGVKAGVFAGLGGILWSLAVAVIGLFSSIWAFAALVLCDIGINTRDGR